MINFVLEILILSLLILNQPLFLAVHYKQITVYYFLRHVKTLSSAYIIMIKFKHSAGNVYFAPLSSLSLAL